MVRNWNGADCNGTLPRTGGHIPVSYTHLDVYKRQTLDRDLRTCGDSAGFLSPGAFPLRPLEGVTVLEVKYDAFLPDLVRLAVQTPGRRAGAC